MGLAGYGCKGEVAGTTWRFPCGHTLGWRVGNLGVVEGAREERNHEET